MVKIGTGLPRWCEATIAVLGLVLAAPVLVVAGLAIALTSGWPIIFTQRRVGQNGRPFDLYKLRTMRPSTGGPQITSGNDVRITRLGRFLRHTKLDEVPTMWNVFRGDMALVGPRPEVPRFVDLENPLWQMVLAVRPGLTDPVTLRLRSEQDLLARINGDSEQYYVNQLQPLKLKGYVAYLEHRNYWTDLSVLWRTMVAVIVPSKVAWLSKNACEDLEIAEATKSDQFSKG